MNIKLDKCLLMAIAVFIFVYYTLYENDDIGVTSSIILTNASRTPFSTGIDSASINRIISSMGF